MAKRQQSRIRHAARQTAQAAAATREVKRGFSIVDIDSLSVERSWSSELDKGFERYHKALMEPRLRHAVAVLEAGLEASYQLRDTGTAFAAWRFWNVRKALHGHRRRKKQAARSLAEEVATLRRDREELVASLRRAQAPLQPSSLPPLCAGSLKLDRVAFARMLRKSSKLRVFRRLPLPRRKSPKRRS